MATSLSPATPAREPAFAAKLAAGLCQDMKANDVVLLNLQGVTDMTDFFIIASGTSVDTCNLDNLRFNIPEPSSVALAGLGALVIAAPGHSV